MLQKWWDSADSDPKQIKPDQRCGCQNMHLSRDTFSYWRHSDPQGSSIWQHLRETKTSPKRKLGRGFQTAKKKGFSIPRRKNYSSFHTCPACPNTWEHGRDGILLFKSLQTQLRNQLRVLRAEMSPFWSNLCSFILCNKICRLFILTVKEYRRQGRCAFGH